MDKMSFEQWFEIFHDRCTALGYDDPDMESAYNYYHQGNSPEESTEVFVTEMGDS